MKISSRIIMLIFILSTVLLAGCASQSQKIYDPNSDINTAAKSLTDQGYSVMFQGYVFEKEKTWSAPFAGLQRFDLPNSWKNTKGTIKATGGSESIPGSGLASVDILYHTMPEKEYTSLLNQISMYSYSAQSDPSAFMKYNNAANTYTANMAQLCSIYAISGSASEQELRDRIRDIFIKYGEASQKDAEKRVAAYTVFPAGSSADFNFYIVQTVKDSGNAFTGGKNEEYRKEYETLHENIKEILPKITFARPLGLTEINLNADRIQFSTTDLKGNPVTSEDFFAEHKVTMLNIWSTTCSVCYTEIPELQKMQEEFSKEGGQIAGLLYDGDDPELAAEAQKFLDEYGITYPNIAANQELKAAFPTQSFPMTYFFNEQGEMIGEPVIGANLNQYRESMMSYLGER
ncbi:MAG: TlpA family protein disulfide reductase [Anaerolineaceae bacterium]|nr:TlpA family protein disulfide reductase [Anaerolineaceae bacterium]